MLNYSHAFSSEFNGIVSVLIIEGSKTIIVKVLSFYKQTSTSFDAAVQGFGVDSCLGYCIKYILIPS